MAIKRHTFTLDINEARRVLELLSVAPLQHDDLTQRLQAFVSSTKNEPMADVIVLSDN